MSSSAEKLEAKMKSNGQETRIALLEQSIININQTMLRIESDLKDFKKDTKQDFSTLNVTIETLSLSVDKKLDGIYSRIWQLFFSGIGALAFVLLVIAHGFKWY